GSIFNAPVQKYVEIPAANSLLMSNWFPDLGLMGFLPDTNMITYHKETVIETVESLLKDEEKIKRISSNGHNLILMRHTSEIRAKQFINFMCNIIGRNTYYDVEPCSFQVCFRPREQIKKDKQQELPKKQRVVRRVAGTDWRSRIKQAKL
ncbi:MAG: glycosyltransferase, partial [Candidatus Thorarchaeota archaeon]